MTFDTRNSVIDVGFLSPDLDPLIATVRKPHAVWFRFAEDINRTRQGNLAAFKPSQSVPVRDVVGVALLIRSLSNYQGALLLAERGMHSTDAVVTMTSALRRESPPSFDDILQKSRNSKKQSIASATLDAGEESY